MRSSYPFFCTLSQTKKELQSLKKVGFFSNSLFLRAFYLLLLVLSVSVRNPVERTKFFDSCPYTPYSNRPISTIVFFNFRLSFNTFRRFFYHASFSFPCYFLVWKKCISSGLGEEIEVMVFNYFCPHPLPTRTYLRILVISLFLTKAVLLMGKN